MSSTSTPVTSGASKNIPRIVPWLNVEEWRNTRKLLYSSKVEEIRLGLLQAKIWMDRGKVPTAVESTVNFLETVLLDQEYLNEFLSSRMKENQVEESDIIIKEDTNPTGCDDRLLRLAYNAAVIRFVNEIVDRAQKSLFATSITKLADQIGLPRVFVDIRHDGTHDKMNSLELLRWAAWEALKWLEDQYWSFEDDITPVLWLNDFNANVHGLLDQFCDQLEKISEIQSAAALEKSSHTRIVSQIDFLQTLPRIMKAFLGSLCEYKRFVSGSGNDVNVLEAIIRPLARNTGDIFYPSVVDVLLERKESDNWIPWIVEELKRSNDSKKIDTFASNLLEKLAKIWTHLGPILKSEKISKVFKTFESVYQNDLIVKSDQGKLVESRNLVQKRRFVEDENLDGWSVVNENWRPCPLGMMPSN